MPFSILEPMERLFIDITGVPGNDWRAMLLLCWKDGEDVDTHSRMMNIDEHCSPEKEAAVYGNQV
jgi:hypothetical protein